MKPAATTTWADVIDEARWRAIVARDHRADGQFFYSVSTTGVYCRPSCSSRQARREHVGLHATCEAAEAAGFRPCRRCRPDEPSDALGHQAIVERACRTIQASAVPPALDRLAAEAHLSPHHFHRLFKSITGLTPRQFAVAVRASRARDALARAGRITDVAYDAGFGSAGRFYAAASVDLGMTPGAYKRGGAGLTIHYGTAACSLGVVLAASTSHGVCAVMLGGDADRLVKDLTARFPQATLAAGDRAFAATLRQVAAIVDEPGTHARLPLDLHGTAFQQRVWRALQAIPLGTTVSYGELARRIGAPSSVRAVAAACGANPAAVLVPCHRVVGRDGALTGYRWGVERKKALIEREGLSSTKDEVRSTNRRGRPGSS